VLEFIVLGQIPGTNLYLNFTEVLLLWVLTFLLGKTLFSVRHYKKLGVQFEQLALYFNLVIR
jgi:hypothetical protein